MKFLEILLESREDDFKSSFSKKFKPEQIEMIIDVAKQLPSGTKFLTFLGKTLPNSINNEFLNDKVYELMESYLPKTIPDIQKQYLLFYLVLLIMSNIRLLEPDLISKLYIVIKLQRTLYEIGLFNILMILIDV